MSPKDAWFAKPPTPLRRRVVFALGAVCWTVALFWLGGWNFDSRGEEAAVFFGISSGLAVMAFHWWAEL